MTIRINHMDARFAFDDIIFIKIPNIHSIRPVIQEHSAIKTSFPVSEIIRIVDLPSLRLCSRTSSTDNPRCRKDLWSLRQA